MHALFGGLVTVPAARVAALAVDHFRSFGFVVLPGAFDPVPLCAEVDRALAEEFAEATPGHMGSVGNAFQYLPMMSGRTPRSLELLGALVDPAARLLGRAVLPVRAKGTRYFGGTRCHRDSELEVPSVGFLGYLEPLDVDTGALWVLPGSHRRPWAAAPPPAPVEGAPAEGLAPGEWVQTQPGDILALDEHLVHGSASARSSLQWRVDFIADPVGSAEEATARSYFDQIFQPGWDGGYDVDRYPSYDSRWRQGDDRWVERLATLGAYDHADIEEAAVRSRRTHRP